MTLLAYCGRRALLCLAGAILAGASNQPRNVLVHVSPAGDDRAAGSADRPFRTLARAQQAVRSANRSSNVTVVLGDGTYRLTAPLVFGATDGGQGDHRVVWRAAQGARPVISGGVPISNWSLHDAERQVYVADVPKGWDSRQLYVDGVHAYRAMTELHQSDVSFDAKGVILKGEAAERLKLVSQPKRLELEVTGLWTDRYTPVTAINGNHATLAQPAWYNNTTSHDTINAAIKEPHIYHVYLVNAPEFLGLKGWHGSDNQWFVDPAAGKLYLKPNFAQDIGRLSVIFPRLQTLISISGTHERPVRNLSFEGLRFSHTSWMGPSSPQGYANVQTGAFLTGLPVGLPPAPFGSCFAGCEAYENKRELFDMIPAAIQVSAARNIRFIENHFTQLGQVALGIGNDAGTNLSGVGLGARSISIERNRFAVLAGGAVIAGGVRADAHHPSREEMRNADLLVVDNVITDVAKDYKDNAAIFVPYFDGARIQHNDISDAPYAGVAIGWGWGHNDVGGTYGLAADWGRYRWQPRYDKPTILRNILVANNRVTNVGRMFIDSGAIYNIGANPGTVFRENFIQGLRSGIALYLDQGTKFVRIERNVADTTSPWLHANNGSDLKGPAPGSRRIRNNRLISERTVDNAAAGNWHNSVKVRGDWIPDLRNQLLGNHLVADKDWPADARAIIAASGVRKPE